MTNWIIADSTCICMCVCVCVYTHDTIACEFEFTILVHVRIYQANLLLQLIDCYYYCHYYFGT